MYCNAKSPLNLIAFCDSSKFRLFICRVAIRISDGYECVLHQLYIEACDKSYHRGNGRKECISAAKERFVACWQDFPETVVDGLKFPYEASEEQQSTFHEVYDVAKEMFHNIDCGRLFPFAKEYADEQVAECEARLNLALRKLRVFDSGSMHLRGEQDMGSLTRAKMRNIFKEWIEVVITLSPVKKAYLVLGRSVIMDKSSALK